MPVVLTREEVSRVLARLPPGVHQLVCGLLYGCGLRVLESLALTRDDLVAAELDILHAQTQSLKHPQARAVQ